MTMRTAIPRCSLIVLAALLTVSCGNGRQVLPRAAPDVSHGHSLYVDGVHGGAHGNGSYRHPYLTINQCATTAQPGTTCFIRGGFYREIVRPNNGITIRPFGKEQVVLLAMNPVTRWKRSAGNIYVARVLLNPGLSANQVFVGPGTTMLNEAQWPTPSQNPMFPNWATEQKGSTLNTIVDSALPHTDLTGAIAHVWAGTDPWQHLWGPVTSSSHGRIRYLPNTYTGSLPCNIRTHPICQVGSMPGGFYYITGLRGLLKAPGEWWYDASGKLLYVWAPGGSNPNKLDVEAKQRIWVIDISGRRGVTVAGLTIVGGGIFSDSDSVQNTIDGITALYVSQMIDPSPYPDTVYLQGNGIVIDGTRNIIENSTIAYSATNGIYLLGYQNVVTNNLIHDVGWLGDGNSSGVQPGNPNRGGHIISHNTIYNTGGKAVHLFPMPNIDVGYNNFFNSDLMLVDAGAIYAGGDPKSFSATGTRVHDNWLHTGPLGRLPPSNACSCGFAGMYIDQNVGGISVDHNIVWDSEPGINILGTEGDIHIDSNTVLGTAGPSIVLGCFPAANDGCSSSSATNNRIYAPIDYITNPKFPSKDNS